MKLSVFDLKRLVEQAMEGGSKFKPDSDGYYWLCGRCKQFCRDEYEARAHCHGHYLFWRSVEDGIRQTRWLINVTPGGDAHCLVCNHPWYRHYRGETFCDDCDCVQMILPERELTP